MTAPASFTGKRVLVTGGLGFIGSTLGRRLADLGAHVVLVDSLIPEHGANAFNINGYEDRLQVSIGDVRDEFSMRQLVRDQDLLFSLAGQTSHLDSMTDPYTDLDINVRSQISILESCRKHNPDITIVYASTRQVYGKPDYVPVDEKHPLHPTDVNGINKMAGEWYHILYHRVYGLRVTSLRLTNTYGPRMRVRDARQTFLGIWFRRLVESEPIEVWGDGTQLRDFNYVDDVVAAMLRCASDARANGRTYNLGGQESIDLVHLAQQLVEINGGGIYRLIPFPPDRQRIDIGHYFADYSLIQNELGWRPRVELREGLARSLAYFRQHHAHYW